MKLATTGRSDLASLVTDDALYLQLYSSFLPAPAVIDGDVGGSWHHKSWRFYSHEVWHGAIYYNHWHGRIYYQPLLIRAQQMPASDWTSDLDAALSLVDTAMRSIISRRRKYESYSLLLLSELWYSIHFSSGYKLRAISDVKCGFVLIMLIAFQRLQDLLLYNVRKRDEACKNWDGKTLLWSK